MPADRVRGPARSADRAGGVRADGADPGGDRGRRPILRLANGRRRRTSKAARLCGCGGCSGAPWKSTWRGWRRCWSRPTACGAGAAGGPAGQGGGLLLDRGLHDRPGPRAPDVRRRRGGRGGRPEAGDGAGRVLELLLVGDVDYGGDPGAGPDRGASRSAAVAHPCPAAARPS